jgi:hypothetical protein
LFAQGAIFFKRPALTHALSPSQVTEGFIITNPRSSVQFRLLHVAAVNTMRRRSGRVQVQGNKGACELVQLQFVREWRSFPGTDLSCATETENIQFVCYSEQVKRHTPHLIVLLG